MKLSLLISTLGAVTSVIALTTQIPSMQVSLSWGSIIRRYLSDDSYFFRACGNQPSDEAVRQIEANFPAYKVDSDVHVDAVTLNVSSFLLPKSNYLK